MNAIKVEIDEGAVLINNAFLCKKSKGIHCIEIDLTSKYAEVIGYQQGSDGVAISFGAGEHTLHTSKTCETSELTLIKFPTYKGWRVFSLSPVARYTCRVVLIKEKE
jgi:hypothetical protein